MTTSHRGAACSKWQDHRSYSLHTGQQIASSQHWSVPSGHCLSALSLGLPAWGGAVPVAGAGETRRGYLNLRHSNLAIVSRHSSEVSDRGAMFCSYHSTKPELAYGYELRLFNIRVKARPSPILPSADKKAQSIILCNSPQGLEQVRHVSQFGS